MEGINPPATIERVEELVEARREIMAEMRDFIGRDRPAELAVDKG